MPGWWSALDSSPGSRAGSIPGCGWWRSGSRSTSCVRASASGSRARAAHHRADQYSNQPARAVAVLEEITSGPLPDTPDRRPTEIREVLMTGLRRLVPVKYPAAVWSMLVVVLASVGCTRSAPREATPAPNSAAAARSEPPLSQPDGAAVPASGELDDDAESTPGPVGALEPAAPPAEPSRVGSRKAEREGPKRKSSSAKPPASRAAGSGGLEPSGAAEALGPSLADPPELRAALADFQGAFEQLSAGVPAKTRVGRSPPCSAPPREFASWW